MELLGSLSGPVSLAPSAGAASTQLRSELLDAIGAPAFMDPHAMVTERTDRNRSIELKHCPTVRLVGRVALGAKADQPPARKLARDDLARMQSSGGHYHKEARQRITVHWTLPSARRGGLPPARRCCRP